jgi:hypothetical protein
MEGGAGERRQAERRLNILLKKQSSQCVLNRHKRKENRIERLSDCREGIKDKSPRRFLITALPGEKFQFLSLLWKLLNHFAFTSLR